MALSDLISKDTCSECNAPLSASMRHCPTCRADAGAPNVRRCRTAENLDALISRYDTARKQAGKNGYSNEFEALEDLLKKKSHVVVSMPAGVARKLLEDPSFVYVNYERLVGSGSRKPASSDNDRHRCYAGGVLFGSYANSIVYGALSLTKDGLPTYGSVYCRLRSIAIEKRTSFLETNNFKFIYDHKCVEGGELPLGYMACWETRHNLVLAKMADCLSTGQTESDWQAILIQSDDKDRKNDDLVEAHIYDFFDINAIESMVSSNGKSISREEKLDRELAIANFKRLREKAK